MIMCVLDKNGVSQVKNSAGFLGGESLKDRRGEGAHEIRIYKNMCSIQIQCRLNYKWRCRYKTEEISHLHWSYTAE